LTPIRSARSAITPAAFWSGPRSSSPAATTPIPAASTSRRARRCTWSRRSFWWSRTGSATRWSPICAAPSPATAAT
jgi:hypothetical protein